jgi:asparagine synthetase B (glutamine-hydrolysing)
MCGYIFSYTKKIFSEEELHKSNTFIKHRGPSATKKITIKSKNGMNVTMLHNLLDISGESVVQPISRGKVHLLFNGEIYNYLDFASVKSDTAALLHFIEEDYDSKDKLDGEFVMLSYSENEDILDILTDPFLTKPLYFGRSDDPSEFACASYPSALSGLGFNHIYVAQPNTNYKISLSKDSITISEKYPVHIFENQQTSINYDAWCESFIEAVRKRALHGGHRPMVALSSGYDSGCISLAMKLLNIKFNTYTMQSGENVEIINRRCEYLGDVLNNSNFVSPASKAKIKNLQIQAQKRIENLKYHHNDGGEVINMFSDPGAIGSYIIASEASSNGELVNLSGSGGDEIYSDYGFRGKKHSIHSEFGGVFPDNLEGFFPWKKFYGDTQRSYLMKEEFVFGAFGIESRYPYLDKAVVGEFLKLHPTLKNSHYKAPLHYFMEKYEFPFELNSKRGFAIRKPPLGRRVRQTVKDFFKTRERKM